MGADVDAAAAAAQAVVVEEEEEEEGGGAAFLLLLLLPGGRKKALAVGDDESNTAAAAATSHRRLRPGLLLIDVGMVVCVQCVAVLRDTFVFVICGGGEEIGRPVMCVCRYVGMRKSCIRYICP